MRHTTTTRHLCTPADPWTKDKGRGQHPDAKEVSGSQTDGWPSGDTVDYLCPHCGLEFEVELAQ